MANALRRPATAALVAAQLLTLAPLARAGVKTEEKTRVELGGPLGGILKLFGGKGAKEGVVTQTAVFGDRRLVAGPEAAQIIDLKEGVIYELDLNKKTYSVTTFAELRQRFEEQKAKAEAEVAKAQAKADKQAPAQQPAADPQAKEFEVDFQASNTAERREVMGHEARLVVLRATVHEKGRSVQQAGGLMIRNDLWLVPKLKQLDELEAWNRRYALKMAEVYGAGAATVAVEQMAKLYALYPGVQKAMEKMRAETDKVDLEGTTVAATLTVSAIKSAEQVAAAEKDSMKADTGVTGLLAKKMFHKAAGDPTDPRTMLLTSSHELLKLSADATEADVALPAGLKRK